MIKLVLVVGLVAGSACTNECIVPGLNCDDNAALPVRVSALVVGTDHTCALRENGTVECWGLDCAGNTAPPDALFDSITAGEAHTCGRTRDGAVLCWGDPAYTQVPEGVSHQYVVAGRHHTCTTGSLRCWGANDEGQSTPPVLDEPALAALGSDHGCARGKVAAFEDKLVCWGRNDVGQATVPTGVPVPIYDLVAGERFTCGNDWSRGVTCWGEPPAGFVSPSEPVAQGSLIAGPAQLCIHGYGEVPTCWADPGAARPPDLEFEWIVLGARHGCGQVIDGFTGRIVCWGDNEYGQATPPE